MLALVRVQQEEERSTIGVDLVRLGQTVRVGTYIIVHCCGCGMTGELGRGRFVAGWGGVGA